jgi:hypothetical protein
MSPMIIRDGALYACTLDRETQVAIISNSAVIRVIRAAYHVSPYRAAMLAAGRLVHLAALVELVGEHDAGRLITREMAISLGKGRLLR